MHPRRPLAEISHDLTLASANAPYFAFTKFYLALTVLLQGRWQRQPLAAHPVSSNQVCFLFVVVICPKGGSIRFREDRDTVTETLASSLINDACMDAHVH